MDGKGREFQLQLEGLHGASSRYISLSGLKSVKLPKSDYELKHWIGYREKTFEPTEVGKRKLITYAVEALSGQNAKPARIIIPEQVSGLYHINGFYFKIFEQEFGHPIGEPRIFADGVLSERLLYSESWNDVIGEIRSRGLGEVLKQAREKRIRDFKEKKKGFTFSLEDSVNTPWQEKMWENMRKMQEEQKRARENPSREFFVGASV